MVSPPPNLSQLNLLSDREQDMDLNEDITVVNSQLPSSLTPSGEHDQQQQITGETSTKDCKADSAWIVQCTKRIPANPLFTQSSLAGQKTTEIDNSSQLPKKLTHTSALLGSFLLIYLSTPPWFNLLPEQREHLTHIQN